MRSPSLPMVTLVLALGAALAGCPQERPGAEKQIPPQRIPPAVTVDLPSGADGGAQTPSDGGGPRAR